MAEPIPLSLDTLGAPPADAAEPALEATREPIQRELEINITYPSPDGKTYRGVAVCITPSRLHESTGIVRRINELTGGIPIGMVPTTEASYFRMVAVVLTHIGKDDRPDWFANACEESQLFVECVYKEVIAHRERYFPQGGDHATCEEAARACGISVSSAFSRANTDA